MKRKRLSIVLLVALGLILSLAFSSWARPWGVKAHRGWFAKLTPEQAGQLFDLRQKFMNDTASLRKEKVMKKAELRALWRAEHPDEKQILAKLKEINALRDQLQEKRLAFRLQARKICPKGPGPEGKVSMENEDMNLDQNMAMGFSGHGDIGS
jgi:zinc resistance-associated protein